MPRIAPALSDLPLAERLRQMEALWDSLCRDPAHEPSPAWHAQVLEQRREELRRGEHQPWHEVRQRLRQQVR